MGLTKFLKEKNRGFQRQAKLRVKRAKSKARTAKPDPAPLECPRHKVPYSIVQSSDPIHEGDWRHFFCQSCRQERRKVTDGAAVLK